MILFLMAMAQGLEVEVRQKSPEVRLAVRAPKEESPNVLVVRRWILTSRGGALEEGWADVAVERAEGARGGPRAECALAQAGTYQISVGETSGRVEVSRSDLSTWKVEIEELRGIARRLETIAADVDRLGKPSPSQAAQVRKRLQAERERLAMVKSGFHAGVRALEEALDRLFFYRTLQGIPDPPKGETAGGYGPPSKEKDEEAPTAAREVKTLQDLIAREGAILLLDELRLLRTASGDPSEIRIVRWRDPDKALAALRQAHEALGGFAELGDFLKEPADVADPEDFDARLRKLRASLLRP